MGGDTTAYVDGQARGLANFRWLAGWAAGSVCRAHEGLSEDCSCEVGMTAGMLAVSCVMYDCRTPAAGMLLGCASCRGAMQLLQCSCLAMALGRAFN